MAGAPTPCGPAVVLDTNVVMALWLFGDPRLVALREALEERRLLWWATDGMIDELRSQLRPERCERYGSSAEQVLHRCDSLALRCGPLGPVPRAGWPRCTDPDDQPFIDLALASKAQGLLSRDRAVLKLRLPASRLGLKICKPEDWALAAAGPSS